jgi:hypothetical protein
MSEGQKSSSFAVVAAVLGILVLLGIGLAYFRAEPPSETPPRAITSPAAPESAPVSAASVLPSESTGAEAQAAPAAVKPAPGSAGAAAPGTAAGTPGAQVPSGSRLGRAGAPPPLTAQAMLRRSFSGGITTSENLKGVDPGMRGFDLKKSGGVEMKRAPEVSGFLQFTTTPARVKPGDKYSVRVALVNSGQQPIEIKEVLLLTTVNGNARTETVKPLVKQVASRQNEVIHELSGSWDRSIAAWKLEVAVTSTRQDVYRNALVWK